MSSAASGCLTELAAIGNQDAYLTINPEVTFFKQLYRRHTNFSICEADIGFVSAIGFDRTITATIPRNGDLINKTYFSPRLSALDVDVTAVDGNGNNLDPATAVVHYTNAVGHVLPQRFEFIVGGQNVDILYGDFLQIWERVSGQPGKPLEEMIGQYDNVDDLRDFAARDRTLHIPLPFYYSKHWELSLPLIALQYHETKINVVLRRRQDIVMGYVPGGAPGGDYAIPEGDITGGVLIDAHITLNFVYLDTMERRIHAQQPHEFLITQLQYQGGESIVANTLVRNVPTHFNHPIIELFIVYQENRQTQFPLLRWFNYGVDDPEGNYPWQAPGTPVPLVDPILTIRLQLNGHDRIAQRDAFYFRSVVPWERHTKIPNRFIYNYCFALHPEDDVRPSGTCNFSRIDNVIFTFRFIVDAIGASALLFDGEIRIYARSYNVVKIARLPLARKVRCQQQSVDSCWANQFVSHTQDMTRSLVSACA